MPKRKETRGRPKLPKGMKRKFCNLTLAPEATDKLDTIKRESKSRFVSAVLEMIPRQWMKDYERDPKIFLDKLSDLEIAIPA